MIPATIETKRQDKQNETTKKSIIGTARCYFFLIKRHGEQGQNHIRYKTQNEQIIVLQLKAEGAQENKKANLKIPFSLLKPNDLSSHNNHSLQFIFK